MKRIYWLVLCFLLSLSVVEAQESVAVFTATNRNIPYNYPTFGVVQSFVSVTIRPQITGVITGVHFQAGAKVRAGDLLFTIDQRSYAADWRNAEAKVAKDKVEHERALRELGRQKALRDKGITAEESYDDAMTAAQAAAATLAADEALRDQKALYVEYCTIRAPCAGKVGDIRLQPGNLAQLNESILTTIEQLDQVKVAIGLPQQYLSYVVTTSSLPVLTTSVAPVTGQVFFVNNTVDQEVGTIQLKGLFPNPQNLFWPGQFIAVDVMLEMVTNALVIPSQAIMKGQGGDSVFVVTADQIAKERPVKVRFVWDETAVIIGGLEAGEQVVTVGQQRLVDGAKVVVRRAL